MTGSSKFVALLALSATALFVGAGCMSQVEGVDTEAQAEASTASAASMEHSQAATAGETTREAGQALSTWDDDYGYDNRGYGFGGVDGYGRGGVPIFHRGPPPIHNPFRCFGNFGRPFGSFGRDCGFSPYDNRYDDGYGYGRGY